MIQEKNLFTCQVCDKKFARKNYLVRHQATHSDVESFKCSISPVGRSIQKKSQLTNHIVYHYEPKFACSHCEHKTHRKFDLDKHLKTHGKLMVFFSSFNFWQIFKHSVSDRKDRNQQKLYQVKNLSTDDEIVRKSSKSVNFKGSNYFSTYS